MAVGMLLAGEGITEDSYRKLSEKMFGSFPMPQGEAPDGLIIHSAGQSDQASQVTNSRVVNVTAAPNTSYVGVTNQGFSTASPAPALASTLQWSFIGPASTTVTWQPYPAAAVASSAPIQPAPTIARRSAFRGD